MDKKSYEQYLQSPTWRLRRNRALKSAGYRCARCYRKRRLQVHHRTYERLGNEHEADLEVLCEDCHNGHHLQDMAASAARIYLKLASEALAADPWADLGDLSEAVKRRCVALRITPYDVPAIDRALALISASNRLASPIPKTRDDLDAVQGRPITHEEARECLHRLGLDVLIKTVSESRGSIEIDAPVERNPDEFAYEVFW